jgi:hypothetical protein
VLHCGHLSFFWGGGGGGGADVTAFSYCISRCPISLMIQASALSGLSHVIARTGSGLNC